MSMQTVLLGEVAEFLNGGTPSKSCSDFFNGDIPWITGADITSSIVKTARSYITDQAVRKSATNVVPAGTVLLVTRTSVGKVAITGVPLAFSQDITAIVHDPGRVDSKYLAHFLTTQQVHFERVARGATIKGITRSVVESVRLPLPPLDEQRRIVAILDQAEELRAKRRAAIALLDQLPQAIFLEMFGDPSTNAKGWSMQGLGDVCDVRDGTHDSPKYVSDPGFPLVTSKNVTQGRIDLSTALLISEKDYEQINKRSKVERGDIIMPMIGTIGSPVLVNEEPRFAIKNLALIKFHQSSPERLFIHQLLSSPYFDYVTAKTNRGGTQKFVSLGDLRKLPTPIPPSLLQAKFAARVEAIYRARAAHQSALAELDALFASLQSSFFDSNMATTNRIR